MGYPQETCFDCGRWGSEVSLKRVDDSDPRSSVSCIRYYCVNTKDCERVCTQEFQPSVNHNEPFSEPQ